ncbi:alpha-L-rhamnosidase [Verrucomicrobia bacterium LW23]|nr:alpha-L-rhamnosidase [Verrucomicrobia bacterium LW23]
MNSSTSSSASFGAASWIAGHPVGGAKVSPPAPFLRKAFQLPAGKQVASATLYITALGLYEAELNGQRVGDQVFAPGWTEYTKRVQYQEWDVTSQLTSGTENVLGVVLGDGWYVGYVGWNARSIYGGEKPQLLARLVVTLDDKSTVEVVTDNTWKTSVGPILENDLLAGESHDARRELTGWSSPGYDESAWLPVAPAKDPGIALVISAAPPVRNMGEIAPISERNLGNRRIFDFGQNFTGRVRLKITGAAGATVRLRFAEILEPNGDLYTTNLRGARCTDYYTCSGQGEEVWEPRFTFHGFRYAEAEAIKEKESVKAVGLTGVVLHSDTPPTGRFACSNPLLNQLQHNIVWGQKSNFLEVPTDCPQRDERLGWTGDAQVFIRTAAFNMDVRGFFHKWLLDARDAQLENGGIPPVIPRTDMKNDAGPAWADATIICAWTTYLCYNDKQILIDHLESMERFFEFMGRDCSLGNIRSHPDKLNWGGFGDWLALDGGGKTEGITPKDLIGTAFYAYDAELLGKIHAVLGNAEAAARYRTKRDEIARDFRRRFVTEEGLVVSGTQTAYVLALHFDLLTPETRATATKELVRHIERNQNHLATGFVGTPYLLDVLERNGRLDVAYKLLEQETFPSWLFPVKNGATTIWERWDGWTPDKGFQTPGMNSFNHYAYGAVGAWMVSTVAGLELDEANPGYQRVVFKPRPGGTITWAEAYLKTPQGEAGIHWKLGEKKEGAEAAPIHVDLTVPQGSVAILNPPEGFGLASGESLEFGPGKFALVLEKIAGAKAASYSQYVEKSTHEAVNG